MPKTFKLRDIKKIQIFSLNYNQNAKNFGINKKLTGEIWGGRGMLDERKLHFFKKKIFS